MGRERERSRGHGRQATAPRRRQGRCGRHGGARTSRWVEILHFHRMACVKLVAMELEEESGCSYLYMVMNSSARCAHCPTGAAMNYVRSHHAR